MPIQSTFHHIGIAVFSIEETTKVYKSMGYENGETIFDPEQDVKVCLLHCADKPMLELLEPNDDKSPVNKILAKSGVTAYHQCYEVADITQSLSEYRKNGFMPITMVKYSNVFNADVCFMFNKSIGVIELLQNK